MSPLRLVIVNNSAVCNYVLLTIVFELVSMPRMIHVSALTAPALPLDRQAQRVDQQPVLSSSASLVISEGPELLALHENVVCGKKALQGKHMMSISPYVCRCEYCDTHTV
jgi:hypothetical protein